MIADKMKGMVANSSAIRAMFEEGNRLASLYGAENVYDFSLGNPNVPAPEAVKKAIVELVEGEDPIALHGYTNSNSGYPEVRQAVADSLNERFGTSFGERNIIMTVGAAGGLNVILKRCSIREMKSLHLLLILENIVPTQTTMTACWWKFLLIQRHSSQGFRSLNRKSLQKRKRSLSILRTILPEWSIQKLPFRKWRLLWRQSRKNMEQIFI